MYEYVNNYRVIAQAQDQASPVAQTIVVCHRPRATAENGEHVTWTITELDDGHPAEYVTWTVAEQGGRTVAWNGFYARSLRDALDCMVTRAVGAEVI